MATKLEFTDSIAHNKELIATILEETPPSMRADAKRAAVAIENTVNAIKRDRRSPAAALGMAYAVFAIAAQLVEAEQQGERGSLIQMLS